MSSEQKGGDLFIVDNSISGWTGIRYLKEWTEIAKSFDIATGYFEIGSLLELDGNWQKLDKIRILMGDEVTHRTKRALLEAMRERIQKKLDGSIEDKKVEDPFLNGTEAIVEALKSGKIECRVYNRDKFHAKAYITHAKMEVVGSKALVGSSNFTHPGLNQNVELNIQIQSNQEVAQLQNWYNEHWAVSEDITDDILKVITRQTKPYTPFDVYTKAMYEYFRGHEMTAGEWEEKHSKMFHVLDQYQKEGYWAMMKIAHQHAGAFLCDGVGLGKTFVGLMLIERLILKEKKRVVLFAPKGAREGVWEPHIRDYLPHIGGIGGGVDFSNLAVFSHTDLGRGGDYPERFRNIARLADVIIIDEAHHFRNTGKKGDPETGEDRSRYYKLFDLMENHDNKKQLFMLTATPINNRLSDMRNMIELFSRGDEAYFQRTMGIPNLRGYFIVRERELRGALDTDQLSLVDMIPQVNLFMNKDKIFEDLVVQRSRSYVRESQKRENEKSAIFPERSTPKVAEYSIRKTYGELLTQLENAFEKSDPLFILSMYYPYKYYIGDDSLIDPFEEGRQKQVVGLIRTLFLKRFESSVRAFELSSDRLMRKLLAFIEVNSQTDAEEKRLEVWKRRNAAILDYTYHQQMDLWGNGATEDEDEDVEPQETIIDIEPLDRKDFKVDQIIQDSFQDLDQIIAFIQETKRFKPENDDKLKKLIRLLNSKDLATKKVILFTEYADTARYLKQQLTKNGIKGLEQVDGSTKRPRADIIKCFAPYYNRTSSIELAEEGKKEIRVLISTDVLSEGLNLQDSGRLINYDIHWNPVRLMQRIGRVDRRMNPATEVQIIADHPEDAEWRGTVAYWNFLPPGELNKLLSLYKRVTQKTLLISKTMGIEGRKLLTPEDDYEALKEFNAGYEGQKSLIEELHLEFQDLLKEDPDLGKYLQQLPGAVFSGREIREGYAKGVFFCYSLPQYDRQREEFTEEAGKTRWYYYNLQNSMITEDPGKIIDTIRSTRKTPRRCKYSQQDLLDIKKKILRHITNTHLKQIDAPIGVEASLKCWMELN
jgi:superfamily II DNA or RNA helicase/HKD family nuclease